MGGAPDFSKYQPSDSARAVPARRPEWQSATGVLIAINVAVFLLMVLADRSALMNPPQEMLIKWGADFGPLTLDNQFWRLVTSGFLHIGLLHIAVNMWSLWILGRITERFVGASSLIMIYLLTGIGASLASLAWNPLRVSAGASGPIFGFVGTLMGIFFFAKSRMDPVQRKNLLSWVVRIAVINLFIGLTAGIDNMAHFGGLVTGLAIGSLLVLTMKLQTGSRSAVRANIFVGTLAVLALLFAVVRTQRHDVVYAYQGETALERKDYASAIASFKQLTQAHPNDAFGHTALGYSYHEAKQYPEALTEYQKSLSLNANQPDVKINIACIYTLQGKAQEAIPLFEANMGKVKMDAESYRLFGEALIQTREGERADNMLRNALKLDANDPETHSDLAKALRIEGRMLEAATEMNEADELRKKAKSQK